MKPSLLLPLVLALSIGAVEARGQSAILTPFFAQDGLQTAVQKAKDSIGSDATLTFVGALGNLETQGFALDFYLDVFRGKPPFIPAKAPGQADAWGYSFHSESQGKSITLFVVNLPLLGFQTQSLGQTLPVPIDIGTVIDFAVPYAGSDRLMEQLQKNDDYHSYHSRYSAIHPDLVTLGGLVGDSSGLPEGFPLEGSIWTMTFRAHGDSVPGMVCLVSARSGESFCRSIALPSLGVPAEAGAAGASLAVLPNPALGHVLLKLDLPGGGRVGRGTMLALYDAAGRRVLDLSGSLSPENPVVEIDTRGLAAGVYYCRASGEGWSATVGMVVEH